MFLSAFAPSQQKNQIRMKFNFQDLQLVVTFVSAIGIRWMLAEFMKMKEAIKERTGINNESLKLKLQAYERLTVFAQRAGLGNLVGRMPVAGESAAMLHAAMVTELKNEYEYNTSQQIYVTPEIWNAVSKLKDQNIYIINQDPLLALTPFVLVCIFPTLFFYVILYKISNRFQLCIIRGFANNKKVGNGFRDFTKVQANDFFALLFLNGTYYCFKNFAVFCEPREGVFFAAL